MLPTRSAHVRVRENTNDILSDLACSAHIPSIVYSADSHFALVFDAESPSFLVNSSFFRVNLWFLFRMCARVRDDSDVYRREGTTADTARL